MSQKRKARVYCSRPEGRLLLSPSGSTEPEWVWESMYCLKEVSYNEGKIDRGGIVDRGG